MGKLSPLLFPRLCVQFELIIISYETQGYSKLYHVQPTAVTTEDLTYHPIWRKEGCDCHVPRTILYPLGGTGAKESDPGV